MSWAFGCVVSSNENVLSLILDETEEGGDEDELGTIPSRHIALPASNWSIQTTTQEKLEQAQKYLQLQKTQLAALDLQVSAKKADVAKAELEVQMLEEKKAVEQQNDKIIATVRKIIPTSAAPEKLQDFTELLRLLEYLQAKTSANGLTEAVVRLLPAELARDYETQKAMNLHGKRVNSYVS